MGFIKNGVGMNYFSVHQGSRVMWTWHSWRLGRWYVAPWRHRAMPSPNSAGRSNCHGSLRREKEKKRENLSHFSELTLEVSLGF